MKSAQNVLRNIEKSANPLPRVLVGWGIASSAWTSVLLAEALGSLDAIARLTSRKLAGS